MSVRGLAVRDVDVRLGARRVLERVSLAVSAPGILALAGPNGAGKSTLLRVLSGLLAPDAGSVSLDGVPFAEVPAPERARRIAYLPQDRALHWPLSARAVVALGRLPHQRMRTTETGADQAAIAAAMADMDVAHLAERPVDTLSGGERARVLMARALAQEPEFLLADEPAAGLDPAHQWILFETLARRAAAGLRIVVALHDLPLASRFAHAVALIADHGIVAEGPPAAVFTPATLAAVYGITAAALPSGGHDLIVPTGLVQKGPVLPAAPRC